MAMIVCSQNSSATSIELIDEQLLADQEASRRHIDGEDLRDAGIR